MEPSIQKTEEYIGVNLRQDEFFELSESEIMGAIDYRNLIIMIKEKNYKIKRIFDRRKRRLDDNELELRIKLTTFLKIELRNANTYANGNYIVPIKYKDNLELLRREFTFYLKRNKD
jgi:hypothetical protein